MEITIRAAHLERDREGILSVLAANLPGAGTPERFEWLYRSNPAGPSRVWVAGTADGTVVGTSAAHPRRMRVAGAPVVALVLSDFAFDPGYRSLGPALQLLKATLEPVRSGEFPFSYDFPSESMAAIYRRLGAPGLGPTCRWVRPVRVSPAIRRRLGEGVLSSALGAAADAALKARRTLERVARDVAVSGRSFPLDEEADRLDHELAAMATVRGIRDAAYLNWKYGRHAMWKHEVLAAERGGRLAGLAVYRLTDRDAVQLVELLAAEADVRRAIVARLERLARGQGADRIEYETLDNSADSRILRGLGFVRREEAAGPVAYVCPNLPDMEAVNDANQWWINGGDRDI